LKGRGFSRAITVQSCGRAALQRRVHVSRTDVIPEGREKAKKTDVIPNRAASPVRNLLFPSDETE
jgi:hypothetical protein